MIDINAELVKPYAGQILTAPVLRQVTIDGVSGLAPILGREVHPDDTDFFQHVIT